MTISDDELIRWCNDIIEGGGTKINSAVICKLAQWCLDRLRTQGQADMCPLYNNEAISRGFGCMGYHGRHDSVHGCRHDRCPMKAPVKANDA